MCRKVGGKSEKCLIIISMINTDQTIFFLYYSTTAGIFIQVQKDGRCTQARDSQVNGGVPKTASRIKGQLFEFELQEYQ